MWSEGVIGIPDAKDKEKYTKCHYWVKHYDEPSETYGINGGRISKLMIKIDGKIVCNYDRGWDIEPADENTQRLGHSSHLQRSRDGALHPAGESQLSIKPEYEYSGRLSQ